MAKQDLHGIFPPIATPFINGKVAYDKLASNVTKWNRTGLRGLCHKVEPYRSEGLCGAGVERRICVFI
jgi:hypothetical protein